MAGRQNYALWTLDFCNTQLKELLCRVSRLLPENVSHFVWFICGLGDDHRIFWELHNDLKCWVLFPLEGKKYGGCFQFIFIVILDPYLIASERWKERLHCPLKCLYGPVTVMSELLWFPCETLAFFPIFLIPSSHSVALLLHFNAQCYDKRESASA